MTGPKVYLGVDIGTSGCRTLAVDEQGQVLAVAERSYPLHTPAPGHVEQDPNDWVSGAFATIADVCAGGSFDPSQVAGIGVDGQSWSAIPIAEDGTVLARTPIWMDTRCAGICDELLSQVPAAEVLALAGNRLSPSYSTAKLRWFAQERPEIYARTRWFLQSNSLIVFALTGVISQDHSQGYGLHCIDVATGRYDSAMAARLGIDLTRLPEPVASTAVVGGVTAQASLATGVPVGTPVVAGGLDAACGTLGVGVYQTGQTQEQGGQAGGMSIVVDGPVSDERLILSHHVVGDRWLLQGGTVAGSASLAWLARIVGEADRLAAESSGIGLYSEITRLAGTAARGAGGLAFLPYLSGERSPLWDPDARGVFLGLTLGTGRAELYRSVMEGVAMALRHNLEVAETAGAAVGELFATGGATRSPLWMQIKADVTGHQLTVCANEYATPLGAAMLAALGTSELGVDELVARWVQPAESYVPDSSAVADYTDRYRIWLGVYPALVQSMHDLARKERNG